MIETWLSLPVPVLVLVLAAFYAAVGVLLIGFSFSGVTGPWVRSFKGVVAPFFGAVVVIFAILVGFLANDVWDRNWRAASIVREEAASLSALRGLAAVSGVDSEAIDAAIRAYVLAVVNKEWPSMAHGSAAPEAEAAQDHLLKVVAESNRAPGSNPALDKILIDTALKIREARGTRLTLSSDYSEAVKWASVLLMALIGQISVTAVHLDQLRAQIAAMGIFTSSIILVIGLIAAHEGPFLPHLVVSPKPLEKLLEHIPKIEPEASVCPPADLPPPMPL